MEVREPALVTKMNVDPDTGGFHETRLPSFAQLRHNWMNSGTGASPVRKSQPGAAVPQEEETRAEILASVGKYLVRPPLTEARIAARDPFAGTVTLRHRGCEFGDDGQLHKKLTPDLETVDERELPAAGR